MEQPAVTTKGRYTCALLDERLVPQWTALGTRGGRWTETPAGTIAPYMGGSTLHLESARLLFDSKGPPLQFGATVLNVTFVDGERC